MAVLVRKQGHKSRAEIITQTTKHPASFVFFRLELTYHLEDVRPRVHFVLQLWEYNAYSRNSYFWYVEFAL